MSAHHDAGVVQLGAYRRTAITRIEPLPEPVPSPTRQALSEPVPSLRESVRRLGGALCTFGRELRAWGRAWLRDHRIGFIERVRVAGYADGYCDALAAYPRRSE